MNKWDLIFDFTKTENKLNYSFVEPANFATITKTLDDCEEQPKFVFPLPKKYGGTLDDDANKQSAHADDSMLAFSITTSA